MQPLERLEDLHALGAELTAVEHSLQWRACWRFVLYPLSIPAIFEVTS